MSLTTNRAHARGDDAYASAAGVGGLIWNAFGLYQFAATSGASVEELMRRGMSPSQAELYAGLPYWMDLAFGLGVLGGLAGSFALLMHMRAAPPILFISLAAYVVLFTGDITLGVFAAFGAPQIVVIGTVLLISLVLLWVSNPRTRLTIDALVSE